MSSESAPSRQQTMRCCHLTLVDAELLDDNLLTLLHSCMLPPGVFCERVDLATFGDFTQLLPTILTTIEFARPISEPD